jgi:hypothetical protein
MILSSPRGAAAGCTDAGRVTIGRLEQRRSLLAPPLAEAIAWPKVCYYFYSSLSHLCLASCSLIYADKVFDDRQVGREED